MAAIALVLVLPKMLGIDLLGGNPSPSAVAVATAEITAPPVTEAATPAPTEGPTPTPKLGPPDTVTAAGDKTELDSSLVKLVCPTRNSCRDQVKDRILNIISNLQGKASGAKMVSFGTNPAGTLPITASWKTWHYPYSAADGTKGNLTAVAIDLAPSLVGAPAYALIQDESGQKFTFTVQAADAPDSGGSVIDLGPIYTLDLGGFCALQDCIFAH